VNISLRVGVAIGLQVLAAGCSSVPVVEPPPPIVARAPDEIASLAVHVFQMAQPALTPEDASDYHHMPGYTGDLRRQFQGQLQQAGFTLILDRNTPADLVATIQSDMPHGKVGVATLVLTRKGQVVDRISVPVQVSGTPPKTVHHVGEAAVRLVESLSKSANVASFARELRAAGPAPVQTGGLTVAGGDCPSTDTDLPPEPRPPQVECVIERSVRCQAPSPVLDAWQAEPFTQCPREIPSVVADVLREPARFSPLETRSRRLAGACSSTPRQGECCYVQFTARACR